MQVPVVFVASLAAVILSTGSATAGEPPPAPLPPAEAPAEEPSGPPFGAPVGPDLGTADVVEGAHLDALFTELANPGNENWESTQAQIYAAWNRSGSASMDLLSQRADAAMEEQDLDTALSFLNDLVRLAPDYAEGWNKRATIHFLRDEYGRALEDIARTLTLEPRHFGAYAGLGIILDRLGDKKGALEAYRRAVAIHPHLPGAADGIRKLTREVEGDRA